MFGVPVSGVPHATLNGTTNTTFQVPTNVTLLKRVVLKAPGGSGGGAQQLGNAYAGGGGGGGGEIAIATDVPVAPGSVLTITVEGPYQIVHPTLGTFSVEAGEDGTSAISAGVAGQGGDGGGPSGGARGDPGGDGGTDVDTSTWGGVTITRYSGGGGGDGNADGDITTPPQFTGGDGGAHGSGGAGGSGGSPVPFGGSGGGRYALSGFGNIDAWGGNGFDPFAAPDDPGGFYFIEY